jgi:Ala-tRNA(Pro) deacylase
VTEVPGDCLARVWHLMVVLPSTHHIELYRLSERLQRRLKLTTAPQLRQLFEDCAPGAIPPAGQAYELDTIAGRKSGGKTRSLL